MSEPKWHSVDTVDGRYDEICLPELHDINSRRWCWKHEWITASLCAVFGGKREYSADLCGHNWQNPEKMKSMQQPIRFCRHCKAIGCVHLFGPSEFFYAKSGPYNGTKYVIAPCISCKSRVMLTCFQYFAPSAQGCRIVSEQAELLGYLMDSLPSGFHCELPSQVSELATIDEDRAAEHARNALLHGVQM
jgi:hypothetical protein